MKKWVWSAVFILSVIAPVFSSQNATSNQIAFSGEFKSIVFSASNTNHTYTNESLISTLSPTYALLNGLNLFFIKLNLSQKERILVFMMNGEKVKSTTINLEPLTYIPSDHLYLSLSLYLHSGVNRLNYIFDFGYRFAINKDMKIKIGYSGAYYHQGVFGFTFGFEHRIGDQYNGDDYFLSWFIDGLIGIEPILTFSRYSLSSGMHLRFSQWFSFTFCLTGDYYAKYSYYNSEFEYGVQMKWDFYLLFPHSKKDKTNYIKMN